MPSASAGKMVPCPSCEDLFHVPEEGQTPSFCPNCDFPLDRGVKLCVQCGYNLTTGARIETETEKEEDYYPAWHKALIYVAEVMPGLFRPLNLLLFLVSIFLALILEYIGLAMLAFGAFFACISICSFGLVIYAQGVILLLTDRLEFINQAFIDLEERQWTVFLIMVFTPCLVLFTLMVRAAKAAGVEM